MGGPADTQGPTPLSILPTRRSGVSSRCHVGGELMKSGRIQWFFAAPLRRGVRGVLIAFAETGALLALGFVGRTTNRYCLVWFAGAVMIFTCTFLVSAIWPPPPWCGHANAAMSD